LRRPVLLDTNLLVLLVVGLTSIEYISIHKKLTSFSEQDFEILETLLSEASEIIVTPNTLSEASNLLAYIGDPAKTKIMQTFRTIIQRTQEIHVDSSRAAGRPEFLRLGLTDSVALDATLEHAIVVTSDLDLYLAASSHGNERAINFNHIREYLGGA
jgi:hypothetical protein